MSRYYSQGPLHSSSSGYHGSSSASASASAGSLNRSGSWTSNYAYGLINLHNRQLLPLAHMSILVEKNDFVAEVEIKQRFITSGIRDTTDVRFTFPVPNGAVLYHFDAVVDGRKVVSIIKEKELIRDEVFDDQLGLDSQDRDNALAVNLGWVLPDKEVVVTLKYVTELSLDVDGERIRFVLPSRITPPQRQEFTPDQRSYSNNGKPPTGYKLDIVVNITMPMKIMEVECTQPVSYGLVHGSNGNQAIVRLGSRVGCLKYDYVLLTKIEKTRVDRVIIEPAKSPSEMAVAMILFHAAFLNGNENEKDRWTSKQLNLSIETGDVNVLQITPDVVKIPRSSVVIAYCLLPGFRKDSSSEGTLTLIAKYNDGTTIRVPVAIDQNAIIVEGESLHHLHAKSYMKDLERIISTPTTGTSPLAADVKSEEIQQEIVRLSTTYSLVSRFTAMSIAEERHSNGKTVFKAIPQPSRKYDTSMDLRGNLPEKLDRSDSREYYRSSNGNGDFRSSREGYSAVSSKYVPPMHRSADNIALNASRDYERGWDGKPERWNGRHLTRITTTASPDEQMMNWTENEIESSLSSIIGEREPVRRPFERKEPQSDYYERKRLHSHQHYPQTQPWNGLRSSLGSVSIPGKVEEDLPALISLQQPDGSWLLSRRLENYIPEIMTPIDEVMDSDIQRLARLTQSLDEQFWITMLVVAFLELHNDKSTIEISTAKEKGFLWLSETLGVLGQSVSYWTDRTKSWLHRRRELPM